MSILLVMKTHSGGDSVALGIAPPPPIPALPPVPPHPYNPFSGSSVSTSEKKSVYYSI